MIKTIKNVWASMDTTIKLVLGVFVFIVVAKHLKH